MSVIVHYQTARMIKQLVGFYIAKVAVWWQEATLAQAVIGAPISIDRLSSSMTMATAVPGLFYDAWRRLSVQTSLPGRLYTKAFRLASLQRGRVKGQTERIIPLRRKEPSSPRAGSFLFPLDCLGTQEDIF